MIWTPSSTPYFTYLNYSDTDSVSLYDMFGNELIILHEPLWLKTY